MTSPVFLLVLCLACKLHSSSSSEANVAVTSQSPQDQPQQQQQLRGRELCDHDVTMVECALSWSFNPTSGRITIELSIETPSRPLWYAIGFNSNPMPTMIGSNVVVIKLSDSLHIYNGYLKYYNDPVAIDSPIENISRRDADGRTLISFEREALIARATTTGHIDMSECHYVAMGRGELYGLDEEISTHLVTPRFTRKCFKLTSSTLAPATASASASSDEAQTSPTTQAQQEQQPRRHKFLFALASKRGEDMTASPSLASSTFNSTAMLSAPPTAAAAAAADDATTKARRHEFLYKFRLNSSSAGSVSSSFMPLSEATLAAMSTARRRLFLHQLKLSSSSSSSNKAGAGTSPTPSPTPISQSPPVSNTKRGEKVSQSGSSSSAVTASSTDTPSSSVNASLAKVSLLDAVRAEIGSSKGAQTGSRGGSGETSLIVPLVAIAFVFGLCALVSMIFIGLLNYSFYKQNFDTRNQVIKF